MDKVASTPRTDLQARAHRRVDAKRRASAWEHVGQIHNIQYPDCQITGTILLDSGNGMISLIDEETARAVKAPKVGGVSYGAGVGSAAVDIIEHVIVGIQGESQTYTVLCGVVKEIGGDYNVLLNDKWIEEHHPEAVPRGFMIRPARVKMTKSKSLSSYTFFHQCLTQCTRGEGKACRAGEAKDCQARERSKGTRRRATEATTRNHRVISFAVYLIRSRAAFSIEIDLEFWSFSA